MRYVYCEKRGRNVAATDDRYVYSDRVRPGNVLHVMSCFAGAPEREAADLITMGVESGGENVCIRSRAGTAAKDGMSALNPFLVGEGDRVFAYFPDADEGDDIHLCLNGFMAPLAIWRAASF